MLGWALGGLLELSPDEATAAREALQPHIDIVLRESERRGLGTIIHERIGHGTRG
jgi:hypothetical protein